MSGLIHKAKYELWAWPDYLMINGLTDSLQISIMIMSDYCRNNINVRLLLAVF